MSFFFRSLFTLLIIGFFHTCSANATSLNSKGVCLNTPTRDDASLAAAWAPIIVQTIDAPFRRDYLTRFDYDGDHDPQNNWVSLEKAGKAGAMDNFTKDHRRQVSRRGGINAIKYDMPSSVYYWVIRGDDYDYIGYGLYYLLDGKGKTNDFRVTLLALKKEPDADGHRLVGLLVWDPESAGLVPGVARLDPETAGEKPVTSAGGSSYQGRAKAHARAEAFAGFIEPTSASVPDNSITRNIDLVIDDHGVHPVLYARGTDHQLLLRSPYPDLLFHFSVDSWDDWRGRNIQERDYPNGEKGKGCFMSHPQFGVVYHPSRHAQTVAKKGLHAQGRLWHHWELVGYELLSLSSAAGMDMPSCTGADRHDENILKKQFSLIAQTVAMLSGDGKADIDNLKRLDPRLFNDPAPLFKKHFKSHDSGRGRVLLSW